MLPKIVFMGSDAIALPVLHFLHTEARPLCDLCGVVSQPDRPAGRGQKLTPNPISAYALEHHIPLQRPEKARLELRTWLESQKTSLVIVMAYGHILKETFLTTPQHGCVNLHASILPKYRGASPIQSAIANGETETGVTLMRIEPEMDTGATADVECVSIAPDDTGDSVFSKLAHASVPLLQRNLQKLLTGTLTFTEQNHAAATYTHKLNKEDGWLDFDAPAFVLKNRIQAFDPWPGTFCEHNGVRLKLSSAHFTDEHPQHPPGTIVNITHQHLSIATGKGILLVSKIQRPGGKMLPIREFIQGYPLPINTMLTGSKPTQPPSSG